MAKRFKKVINSMLLIHRNLKVYLEKLINTNGNNKKHNYEVFLLKDFSINKYIFPDFGNHS